MGYKLHARSDDEGYIEKLHMTSANVHESQQLEPLLDDDGNGRVLLADKGYVSQAKRSHIQSRGYQDSIMHKASRHKRLSDWQKQQNAGIERHHSVIERCFGTLKHRFQFSRASYFSREKVEAQSLLKAMCHHLLKAINKVSYV